MTLIVQSNSGAGSGSGTSFALEVVLPGLVTVGNTVCVALAYSSSAGTPSLTSVVDDQTNGYGILQNNALAGVSSCANALRRGLPNTPQTITITVGNSISATINIAAMVYEVNVPSAQVDANVTGSTNAMTGLSIAFSNKGRNDFAFASVANSNSAVTYTQNNGWSSDFSDATTGFYAMSNTIAAAGSGSLSATASASVQQLYNLATVQAPQNPWMWIQAQAPIFAQ